MIMGVSLLGLGAFAPQKTSEGLVWVHSVAAVLIPWAIVLGIVGWIMLKDVPIKANFRQQIDIFGNKNTWILTIIYLMTFGAFSGFAAQLALLINNTFGVDSPFKDEYINLPRGAAYAFLGPLISALVRAAWGPLCDKFGGAIWTFISGVGMTVFTAIAALFLKPSDPNEFNWFLAAMLIMFFFTGIGNAGTFKQMPMILPRRQAGGVIGWTSAIAAFGPFIVGVLLSAMAPTTFFWGCVVFFAFATALNWIYYARPGAPFPG
jgi:transporter, major facilitator family protein